MSEDLVRRLREVGGLDPAAELCSYAADRIERLEGLLTKMIWDCDHDGPEDFCGKDQCVCKAIMPVLGEYDVGDYDA